MRFASPWAFLVLIILPIILYLRITRNNLPGLRFSSIALPLAAGQSNRQRLFRLPLFLRILVLALLALALARPQAGMEKIIDISKGIAVEMVVDRSGSMGAEMEYNGESMARLEVAKKVFAEFVNGNNDTLNGRPNDLIGMINFARYADTACPLTLAHGALQQFLDHVNLVKRREEDGTAIGDALALAAARLKTAEETLAKQTADRKKEYEIKSKIIILLTDGENNTGKRLPLEAAALAKDWGIKIYPIGVGGDEVVRIQTFFGPQTVRTGRGVDKNTLQALADQTGGKFFLAENGEALRDVYEEINQLEKSEVESIRFMDYKEYFSRYALAALAILALETMLSATVFRTAP